MNVRLLFLSILCLLPSGCGFLSHTLNTVTAPISGLLNTVTAPVSGLVHAAEGGTEKQWADKAAATQTQKPSPKSRDDRRRTR